MIRASIHGRLGAAPVGRETRGGKSMVTASVAVDVSKPGDEPATEWVSLVAFGKRADALARHAKGDLISAMGPLTRSTFQSREGEERMGWSLLAESLISVRTVYDRPQDAAAPTRKARVPPRAPNRAALHKKPQRPPAGPPLPDDSLEDLYR